MRAYSVLFNEKNNALKKEIRWVIALSFDAANTDIHYFTSHADCEIPPGTLPGDVTYSVIKKPVINSQKLDTRSVKFTLGKLSFDLLDKSSAVTNLLNSKLAGGDGVRGKRVQVYRGNKGLLWSDYQLLPGSTQLVDSKLSYNKGVYTLRCKDIQRSTQKNIFDIKKTNLTGKYIAGDISLTVASTVDFDMVAHGASFTDAPDATVGYVRIGDNVIRYTSKTANTFVVDNVASTLSVGIATGDTTIDVTDASGFGNAGHGNVTGGGNTSYIQWTGKAGNQLTGVTGVADSFIATDAIYDAVGGGRFNTRDINVDVDASAANDQQQEVEEFIYLEMPATKMVLALLMGTGPTLPPHWHLGISSDYVATSRFDSIGTDLYDPADETAGFILRFVGLKKRDGKKFIQQQVNLPQGCFMPVLADGQLGYKRMSGVVSGASPVAMLDASNVISYSPLDHVLENVQNVYAINWNKIIGKKRPTRDNVYVDTTSISTHLTAKPYELTFEGLHGSRHTDAVIGGTFDVLRDRYSGPPQLITVECFDSLNGVEIGDIVYCNFAQRDFVGGSGLQRAFEVIGYTATGNRVTLNLFGSSQKAGALSLTSATSVMADSFYSAGLQAGNKADAATTGSLTGTVWHITADSILGGGTDMTASGSIFWYPGDVTIDAGKTLTLAANVQLRVMGSFVNNGTLNLFGGGISGTNNPEFLPWQFGGNTGEYTNRQPDTGTPGYIGSTQAQGGFIAAGSGFNVVDFAVTTALNEGVRVAVGANDVAPVLRLDNVGGTDLVGIPADMRGTSGGAGGGVFAAFGFNVQTSNLLAASVAGGDGGSAAVIICRGMSVGASGKIIMGGEPGAPGGSWVGPGGSGTRLSAGHSAPGFPGCLYLLLDGNTSVQPDNNDFSAVFPAIQPVGGQYQEPILIPLSSSRHASSTFVGLGGLDVTDAVVRVQYIPPSETPVEDVSDATSPPVSINVAEVAATQKSINLVALEISVTAPADGNYRGAMVYIKKAGTESWQQVGEARAAEEVIFYVPADGSTYSIKAHGVSILGIEGDDFYGPVNKTVASTQVAVIGAGNTLATGADVATNGGVRVDTNGIDLYDALGNKIFDANANDGTLILGVVSTEKYLKFDPLDGSITLGRDTELRGTNAYNNRSNYFRMLHESRSMYWITTSGSGGVDVDALAARVEVSSGTSGVGVANALRPNSSSINSLDWGSETRFRCFADYQDVIGAARVSGFVGIGGAATYIRFVFYEGSILAGHVFRNGVLYSVGLGSSYQITAAEIEAVKTSTSVMFYIDGVLKGTISTVAAIPVSSDGVVDNILEIECETTLTGERGVIGVGEFRYLQLA